MSSDQEDIVYHPVHLPIARPVITEMDEYAAPAEVAERYYDNTLPELENYFNSRLRSLFIDPMLFDGILTAIREDPRNAHFDFKHNRDVFAVLVWPIYKLGIDSTLATYLQLQEAFYKGLKEAWDD